MRCNACGAELDTGGKFPGAPLVCACGAKGVVPRSPRASDVLPSEGPYRAPARRDDDAVLAPSAAIARRSREQDLPTIKCPRCDRPLDADGGPPGCHRCGGVFLDVADLDRLRASTKDNPFPLRSPIAQDQADVTAFVKCPICQFTMDRRITASVTVDICAKHGAWFDGGELASIAASVANANAHAGPGGVDLDLVRAARPRPVERKLTDEEIRTRASVEVAATSASMMDLYEERRRARYDTFVAEDLITSVLGFFTR